MFVRVRNAQQSQLGVGKIVDHGGGLCSVEYFDAPYSEPRSVLVTADDVDVVSLPEQTRVYYHDRACNAWHIGRLLDDHGNSQLVKFPNGVSRYVEVDDLYVRSALSIEDPTFFLAGKITETPRFAQGRSAFVRSMIAQRASALGMSAVTSSAIEIEAHQFEVVRRILQDPVQRYLLADEVGLGKTIEAGLLIRQCILDGDEAVAVVVIVPEALVPQWRTELQTKFFLGNRLEKNVHVLPSHKLDLIRSRLQGASMLVVDEAHHLAARGKGEPRLYDVIAAASPKIERVILLSATPALHNERGFLEMLHLLDAETYKLDDEEGFRRRIESRQALSEIVAGLTPENVLFLDDALDRLSLLLPEDAVLQNRATALRAITNSLPAEDDPTLIEAVTLVRAHLSESYRLDRRILRHRRRSIGGLTPDRAGATISDYHSAETSALLDLVLGWRLERSVESDEADAQKHSEAALAFARLLEDIGSFGPTDRRDDTLYRRAGDLGAPEMFDRILDRLRSPGIFEDRVEALVAVLRPLMDSKRQFVVFCSSPKTADALRSALSLRLGVEIDRHDPTATDWMRFNAGPDHQILVCDQRAEEGLNLQGSHRVIVHYDLPFNPNRIEQRMGRVDRYGSGEPIRSIILRCEDNPIEIAWIEYVDACLRVFDRSIASLQYLLDESLKTLSERILREGADALLDLIARSGGSEGLIEKEIRQIDQQVALDALVAPSSEWFDNLTDLDGEWRTIESAASGWIEQTLLFSRSTSNPSSGAQIFRYGYATSNQHTLVPLKIFYDHCGSALDFDPKISTTRKLNTVPVTYSRHAALTQKGREQTARLLRYGESMMDGMWKIAQVDERGRSTAFWRQMSDYRSEERADLFFRFDFVVEADISAACRVLADAHRLTDATRAVITRRADMAMPPFFKTIWLDQEFQTVDDPRTLSRLETPYRPTDDRHGDRDFNLNVSRWRKLEGVGLPQLVDWAGFCMEARSRAEAALRAAPLFLNALSSVAHEAERADAVRLGQLRIRDERLRGEHLSEWKFEQELSQSLIEGLRAPKIRIDAALACFVSADPSVALILQSRG